MYSLTDLSGVAEQSFEVTDLRPAGVKFNRQAPLGPKDQVQQITSTTITPTPGIEITEIINYQTANVRLRIRVQSSGTPLLTGSQINWDYIPSHISVVADQGGLVVSNIRDVSDWNYMKSFQWILPSNYQDCPNWYLDVAILYYDEALDEERVVDWEVYDPDNYYVAEITSEVSLTCDGIYCKIFDVDMVAQAQIDSAIGYQFEGIIETFNSEFTLQADGKLNAILMYSDFTLQPTAQAKFVMQPTTISSNAQVVTDVSILLKGLVERTYTSQNKNLLFATNPLYIAEPEVGATYRIVIDSPLPSYWSIDSTNLLGSVDYTGTKDQVNSLIPTIEFYPEPGVYTNNSYTIKFYKNGELVIDQSRTLYGVQGTFSRSRTVEFTSTGTIDITLEDQVYGFADLFLVGGGGGGLLYGGGGGGDVKFIQNRPLSVYATVGANTVTIGAGGQGYTPTSAATAGGTTSAFQVSALGGYANGNGRGDYAGVAGSGAQGGGGGGGSGGSILNDLVPYYSNGKNASIEDPGRGGGSSVEMYWGYSGWSQVNGTRVGSGGGGASVGSLNNVGANSGSLFPATRDQYGGKNGRGQGELSLAQPGDPNTGTGGGGCRPGYNAGNGGSGFARIRIRG